MYKPIKSYFNKISQEEKFIGEIVLDLEKEKDILSRDNITLEIEINKLDDIIEKLEKVYYDGNIFRDEINILINDYKQLDENKANFYVQNVLEPLDKKLYDIKQMTLVKQQSVFALDIIMRNNKEIIRNIDRIKNVTLVALNTAVIVAKSLYNQKIVLSKMNTLENSAGDIINSTGSILLDEGANLKSIAVDSNVDILQNAFKDVLETLDEVTEENKKSFSENEAKVIELK